jgi:excisionase family DNA binding protein
MHGHPHDRPPFATVTPLRPRNDVESYISKQELAHRLSVSTRTVERAVNRGLPAYRVGGQVRFLWSEVRTFFKLDAEHER